MREAKTSATKLLQLTYKYVKWLIGLTSFKIVSLCKKINILLLTTYAIQQFSIYTYIYH